MDNAEIDEKKYSDVLVERSRNLLKKFGLEECRLLLVAASGSDLLTHEKNKDKVCDYVGIFVAPLENILGFGKNRIIQISEDGGKLVRQGESKVSVNGKGLVLYEVGTFLSLLLNGNHRMVEALFAPKKYERSGSWFVQLRESDLIPKKSKQFLEHCFGMVKASVMTGNLKLAQKFLSYCDEILSDDPMTFEIKGDVEEDVAVLENRMVEVETRKRAAKLPNGNTNAEILKLAYLIKLRLS
jgi:hypothetical protein